MDREGRWVVRLGPVVKLDDEQFLELCALNDPLRMERLANGDLLMMTPEGAYSGPAHISLAAQFSNWSEKEGTGELFGPENLFRLPNNAVYAPDLAWVLKARLAKLTARELLSIAPICPDFVLELRSRSDSLAELQAKMAEFMQNGARLGWLLDPFSRKVYVYRPGGEVEELDNPKSLSGGEVLPGFTLEVKPALRVLGRD